MAADILAVKSAFLCSKSAVDVDTAARLAIFDANPNRHLVPSVVAYNPVDSAGGFAKTQSDIPDTMNVDSDTESDYVLADAAELSR